MSGAVSMKDMLFIDNLILIAIIQWGYFISSMQHGWLHGLYKVMREHWNKIWNPLWDHIQDKIPKDLLRNGARKAPSQHILIWCTVPYGLEIINAMFPVFQKIFWDTLHKIWQIWIKTTIMFVTTKYCEDWVINTVFKVLKHLFLKSIPGPLP